MYKLHTHALITRALLFIPILTPTLLAEEAKTTYDPIAMVAAPSETLLVCGSYDNDKRDEQGYWFWKVDNQGKRIWNKEIPATDQTELIALVPSAPNQWLALGQRLVNDGGYTPFILSIDAEGNVGAPIMIEAFGIAKSLIHLTDDTILISGMSRNSETPPTKSDTPYDGWLLNIDGKGKIISQKWLDKGKNEEIISVLQAPEGGYVCLGNSGSLDKFGSGPSDLWLFQCDAEGKIQHEATYPKARFMTKSGTGLLFQHAGLYTLSASLPQSAAPPDNRDPFSFPALIASYSNTLELKWKIIFTDSLAMSTPVLAQRGDQGYLMATAGKQGPALTSISTAGKIEKTINGKPWPFDSMMMIEALIAQDNAAYILGTVTNLDSDEIEDKFFITRFDLATGAATWQEMY